MDRAAVTDLMEKLQEVYHQDPPQPIRAYEAGLRNIDIPAQRYCDEALGSSIGFPTVAELAQIARTLFARLAELQWGGVIRALETSSGQGPISFEDPAAAFALHSLWPTLTQKPQDARFLKRQFVDQFLLASTGQALAGPPYEGIRRLPMYCIQRNGDVDVQRGSDARATLGLLNRSSEAEEEVPKREDADRTMWQEEFVRKHAAQMLEPGTYWVKVKFNEEHVILDRRIVLDPKRDYIGELEADAGLPAGSLRGMIQDGRQGELIGAAVGGGS